MGVPLDIVVGIPTIAAAAIVAWLTIVKNWTDEKKEDLEKRALQRHDFIDEQVTELRTRFTETGVSLATLAQHIDLTEGLWDSLDEILDLVRGIDTVRDCGDAVLGDLRTIRDWVTVMIVGSGVFAFLVTLAYYYVVIGLSSEVTYGLLGILAEIVILIPGIKVYQAYSDYRGVYSALRENHLLGPYLS